MSFWSARFEPSRRTLDFNARGGTCAPLANPLVTALAVTKLDANGAWLRARAYRSETAAIEPHVAADTLADGSVVIAGRSPESPTSGAGLVPCSRRKDYCSAKPIRVARRTGSGLGSGQSFAYRLGFAPNAQGEAWPWSIGANPDAGLLVSFFVKAKATPVANGTSYPTAVCSEDDTLLVAFSATGATQSVKRYSNGAEVAWFKRVMWDSTEPSWRVTGAWGTDGLIAPPLDLGRSEHPVNKRYIDAFIARLSP